MRLTSFLKVRAVGVSNFSIEHLKGIIAATGVVPTVNQIEAHPLLPQDELVAYCKEQNIHITAYSPLGNNRAHSFTDHKRTYTYISVGRYRCAPFDRKLRRQRGGKEARCDGSSGISCVGCLSRVFCDPQKCQ
jgi:aryl-alcohol dehydrogenase-like predicted oxidoreductase